MSEFVAYWDGGELSAYEQLSLLSFTRRGHSVHLYSYSEPKGVPEGVILRDAADVLPPDERIRTLLERRAFPKLSDLLRYGLLREPDRTWIDVDVILLQDDLPVGPVLFAREDATYVNSAVLRLAPDSDLLERLLKETANVTAEALLTANHGIIGPLLLTRLVEELGLDHLALPPDIIYPIASRDLWRLFDPREVGWCDRTLQGAATLHLWNEFLRRAALKGKRPPRRSWLHRSMCEYGVAMPRRGIAVRWVRGAWRQQLPEPPAPPAPGPGQTVRAFLRRVARRARSVLRTLVRADSGRGASV